jgi:raffinose/stachyose/melibiose transport system permease protein
MTTMPAPSTQRSTAPPRVAEGRSLQPPSFWFLAPALAIYTLVIVYPMLAGVGYAFTDWNGLDPNYRFVGLDNFRKLSGDAQVRSALVMTFVFAIALAILQNVAGLGLALALNSRLRLRHPLRLLFFMPVILTPLIVSFLWKYIFSTRGPLNVVLTATGLGDLQQNWLGEPVPAAFSVIVVAWWQSTGLAMVIYIAGLQSIPAELNEAARIDGASPWQGFRHVTLPMLAPAITVTVVNSLIISLKFFDQIYVLTGGGPGYATETMSTLIYKTAFQYAELGYGSAISVVFTFAVAAVVLVALDILRRREIDNG